MRLLTIFLRTHVISLYYADDTKAMHAYEVLREAHYAVSRAPPTARPLLVEFETNSGTGSVDIVRVSAVIIEQPIQKPRSWWRNAWSGQS